MSFRGNIHKDPYFPLSVHVLLEKHKELWERNREIVKIGIEMEQSLLPVELGKKMLEKDEEKDDDSLENIINKEYIDSTHISFDK
ncbi:hypothetical protein PMAC_001840 [Pneumocystis sp. 'macacae']|nr:hypothetical protein PMAC_001840 [Pneumocystis sp. 'macacae']